jgi:predicted NBD/HSP70 family sugar kinase
MHIVADIGGTNTRMAGSGDLMGFSEPIIYDTPKDYKAAIHKFAETAQHLAGHDSIEAVQIGIRGAVLKERGAIFDTVLSDWSEKPLAHDLRVALSIPTVNLENDVATVAMGEAHFGAGKDAGIMVYITVSTGVNGCRVAYGRLEPSSQGFEVGGQYLNIEPTITFEEMVAGSVIHKHFGKHPKELGKDNPIWDELAKLCAYGVHNTILHWSPDRVVLGGSMFNEIGISVPKVAENVKSVMRKFTNVPDIVHSSLGDLGGLWGGVAILRGNR